MSEIVGIEVTLIDTIPRLRAEAAADTSGGYVVFTLDNGAERIPFSVDWIDAETLGYAIVNLAREAKASERELFDAKGRHDELDDGDRCEEAYTTGWCPVCS
jgi:hypothetical protein